MELPEAAVALPEPEFPTRALGYDRAAVDSYLERVRGVMAGAVAPRSPEEAVQDALARVGEETSAVLQRAHQIADEVTARSEEEAAERRQRAEQEAAALMQAAEDRAATIEADVDKLWHERQRLLDDIERIAAELQAVTAAADARFPVEEEAPEAVGAVADSVVTEDEAAEPDDGASPGARAAS